MRIYKNTKKKGLRIILNMVLLYKDFLNLFFEKVCAYKNKDTKSNPLTYELNFELEDMLFGKNSII